jgi:hypothetical protein
MTINLGKRNLGVGTAASPGDTLYIPLAFFNDSGASISIGSSLIAGDIEVFKDGSVTQRATDSGYAILGDTGNFDNRIGFKGISISLFNTADDASFYANGSTYWVAIDSVTVDGRTVRFFPAMFEIGEPRANVTQIDGDTGAADQLQKAFASGFADTGINQRLGQILSDVDTGLRAQISDVDTGLHDTIADLDTGLRGILITTGVNLGLIRGDTGAADRLGKFAGLQLKTDGTLDTGSGQTANTLNITATAATDTGQINQAVWQANAARGITAISDTGVNNRLAVIAADTDTGIQSSVIATALSDTGINARLAAIEAKTGSLTFTVAGQVDANIQYVNDVAIAGTGDTGTANTWRPA